MENKECVMEPSENQHFLMAGGKEKELYQASQKDFKPPQLSFKLKKACDVPKSTEKWSDGHLPIDILLLTVESCDFLSCFYLLDKPFKSYKLGIGYVYFGRMGDASDEEKLKIALMNCPKGVGNPGGPLAVVLTAVRVLRPKATFSVGTCVSLGMEKVRMGDVVISSKLTAEGFKVPVSPLLGSLIQDAPYGWVAPLENPDALEVKVHCDGDILSQSLGEKYRCDDICTQYPGAVAIETEGKGVYAAAYDANIEWVIVKGVASYLHQSQSATSEWMSFASRMAASVVAKMLNDPAVFLEWPHYNQGPSAIPETVQQHTLDAVVTSSSENDKIIKMLIQAVELSKEQKEEVEKTLTQLVQTYEKFNDVSTDNDIEALKAFFEYIILAYGIVLKAVHKKSVIIIVECTSLESLELLWNDYLSGHLNEVAERYLISDEMKKKLNLETNCLKVTIEKENYLSCRKALMELSSTYSAVIDNSSVIQWLKGEYNRRAEFSPLLRSKGVKLELKDLYAKFSVVSSRDLESSEVGVDGIFCSSRKGEDSTVVLRGSPGSGKTFFCLKLAQDWANGAMPSTYPIFELVLLLKCKDIEGHIMDAINEQLLPNNLGDKTRENFLKFVEDVSNQERILVILDGWNEIPKKSQHHLVNVLARDALPCCYLMVTTNDSFPFQFDICLRMKVFSEEDSFLYIREHFKNIGTEKSAKGESLIKEIKRNRLLQDLRSNRPNLFFLCLIYEEHEGELPSCNFELYQALVTNLFRRYSAKQNLKANEEEIDMAKQCERGILALGEPAWNCLLNDRHSFHEEELALERSDEKSMALGLGLVYKEESLKRSRPHHVYTFVHKTFQEYLAASYVAHTLRRIEYDVFEQTRFPEVMRKFRQVFLFVCGMLRDEGSILFTQIGGTLQKDWDWSECSRELASFFTETWKESGNAERMANTLCLFLPFPQVLHINAYQLENVKNVLEACEEFSEVQTPAEVHVIIPSSLGLHQFFELRRMLEGILNLKTLILPARGSHSVDRAKVGEVLKACKTLEKVTFKLSEGCGQGWASALDVGLGADSSLSSVGLRIDGLLNQSALQAVEKLLFNKCLSSLSITMYGDEQGSLAKALARGLAGESALKFLDLCFNGKLSFDGAYSLQEGFLRNKSLRSLNLSVNGELPVNWQFVVENLHAQLAEKGMVSAIYPNTFSKVKESQLTHLNCFLSKIDSVQKNVTLNVWGELSGDGCKAVCEVLLHAPVSHLTLNIHGQLTDEILRCTARCVEEQEKLPSITFNAWVQMTEKENKLIKELGLDKNPSVSLNVHATSAPLKESSDSEVISCYEPESLSAFFEKAKAEKSSSKSLSLTISTQTYFLTVDTLGNGLARGTSLNSLTLAINNYHDDILFKVCESLSYGLAKSTSLKSLTLAINNWSETGSLRGLRILGEVLAEGTSLNSLTLVINNYSDTRSLKEWRFLGRCLGKSASLNSLTLAINDYTDSNYLWDYEFLDALEKNKALTECNLKVSICGKC